jgi:membrane protein YqaA with SNARE-associated domain
MASLYELLGVLLTSFVLNLIPFAVPSNLLIAADAALLVNFDPWVIGFLVAFGSASAKLVHYVITFFAGSLVNEERRELLNNLSQKVGRWAFITLSVAAATPIPDEPIVIPLGLLKYNPIKFYLAYFLGKLSITILGAYLGKTAKNFLASTISQQTMIAVSIILTIAITIILLKVDINKILQNIKRKWQTRKMLSSESLTEPRNQMFNKSKQLTD